MEKHTQNFNSINEYTLNAAFSLIIYKSLKYIHSAIFVSFSTFV